MLSKHFVFRRAKDLIDVYALAHCVEVRTSEVFDVLISKSAIVGEFAELFTRRNDVEHAYDKLKGIDGKPPFDDVYPYLIDLSVRSPKEIQHRTFGTAANRLGMI